MRALAVSIPKGVVLAVSMAASTAAASPFFAITPTPGTSYPGVSNSAVLVPGPGPPGVFLPPAALGVAGAPTDDVNAFTIPGPLGEFFFSVDAATTGSTGAVASEAGFGQAAGDIYGSALTTSNFLVINQDVLGLVPALPPGVAASPPIDDLNALEFDVPGGPGGPLHFAMVTGHPYAGSFTGCGADIFTPGPALAISYFTLGLGSCSDDIDALHIDSATGDVYFSLAPGSPSFSILGLPGPAAIYVSPAGAGPVSTAYTAGLLGLHTTDNVDAIAWIPPLPKAPMLGPVAQALLMASMGVGGAWFARRRRRAQQP